MRFCFLIFLHSRDGPWHCPSRLRLSLSRSIIVIGGVWRHRVFFVFDVVLSLDLFFFPRFLTGLWTLKGYEVSSMRTKTFRMPLTLSSYSSSCSAFALAFAFFFFLSCYLLLFVIPSKKKKKKAQTIKHGVEGTEHPLVQLTRRMTEQEWGETIRRKI